ncbi:MAG: TetR family transcriptional regulator [Amycolatopsis sp.]|jgi:AcrR family transcriptional regulator|uniref:TetR/AcrR family transcriptional regulator n=1 Tax=Amycolatopsis sp. TaxID=37632 RepID=UPI002618EDAA|nr:TetR/AcrR family transcriptional regulator [Amycolatopsis sp.]MCU1684641.1 TetR family transcriptional regulator [Amycolatopsis sp.]
MRPEDRRAMIVRSVLPLVLEHGAAVTTNQIARAAGIGEGTIFRAFKDKDELLDACVAEAIKPDDALAAIAEIPLDQPLSERLVEAADTLAAHLQRMGSVMSAMHASGRAHRNPEDRAKRKSQGRGGRRDTMTAMRAAMADLFEPEQDKLRLPAEQVSSLFLSLLFGGARVDDESAPTTRQIVDVFLNGAVAPELETA